MNGRPKVCRQCGALLDLSDPVCPYCQHRAPPASVVRAQRMIAVVPPEWRSVTTLLIAANVTVLAAVFFIYGTRGVLDPDPLMLMDMGALSPDYFIAGEYWRMITYGFLHIGLLHIIFNMGSLSQLGAVLEGEIGGARFFVVYLLSLVGGGAMDVIVRGPISVSIAGASGAIFGLIGFGLSYAHFQGSGLGRMHRKFFLQWAIYGFIFGFVVDADNIAHAGGLIVGAVLGFVMAHERSGRDRLTPFWQILAVVLLLVTIGAFGWMIDECSYLWGLG